MTSAVPACLSPCLSSPWSSTASYGSDVETGCAKAALVSNSAQEQVRCRTFYAHRSYIRPGLLVACCILVASVLLELILGDGKAVGLPDLQTTAVLGEKTQLEDVNHVQNASIGKVTMLYGDWVPTFERALALQALHNQRWGYSSFTLRTRILPEYWSKPAYILKVLLAELEKPVERRLQWLLWMDADIVLMNQQIPLEIFLPPEKEWDNVHCLVTNDFHGLNNDVFFLKVHEWSVWLMSAVVSTEVFQPGVKLRWGDQSALERLLSKEQFKSQTRHVPQRWFNAFAGDRGMPDPDPSVIDVKRRPSSVRMGDLLVHFPAHYAVRERRMNLCLNTAEKHQAPWEVPLENTTYMDEIAQFWARGGVTAKWEDDIR